MKRRYAKLLIKVAHIVEIEDLNIPDILDTYNADGKSKVESVEIVELDGDDFYKELDKMLA